MSVGIRLGLLAWNQYTDWPSLRDAGARADGLGYDDIWTWDHLYPIVGSHEGPMLEGWMTLGAWAKATKRARIGLMVGANTMRNPALVAKMATTLDHISGGRAVLGIGGAWFETEHTAYGIPYGESPGERLRWLDEAVSIMRGMLDGSEPSGRRHYAAREVRNDPPPLQRRLPILVGGGGERRTLRTVAKYADACNLHQGPGIEALKHKEEVLRRHCDEVGRDESEIERTLSLGTVFIRDSRTDAQRAMFGTYARNGKGRPWANQLAGTPEEIADRLRPFVELGYRHLIAHSPAPYDAESMERMIGEVKPLLERAAGSAAEPSA